MGFWETIIASVIASIIAGGILLLAGQKIRKWLAQRVSIKIKEKEGYIYADCVVHIKLTYRNKCQNMVSPDCFEARLIPGDKNNSEIILSLLVQRWERPASPGEIGYVNVEYHRQNHDAIPTSYSTAILTIRFGRRPVTMKIEVPLVSKEKRDD